jgi:hypothetical protein
MAQQDTGPVAGRRAPSVISKPDKLERQPKQGLAEDITDRAESGDEEERAVAQAVIDLDSSNG